MGTIWTEFLNTYILGISKVEHSWQMVFREMIINSWRQVLTRSNSPIDFLNFSFRADCSNVDKVGGKPEHNGLSSFGKVKTTLTRTLESLDRPNYDKTVPSNFEGTSLHNVK